MKESTHRVGWTPTRTHRPGAVHQAQSGPSNSVYFYVKSGGGFGGDKFGGDEFSGDVGGVLGVAGLAASVAMRCGGQGSVGQKHPTHPSKHDLVHLAHLSGNRRGESVTVKIEALAHFDELAKLARNRRRQLVVF